MVSPTQRRAGVRWAREAYQLPERRACRVMGFSRSTERYQSVRPSREPLRARLKELAAVRVSYGYRRLHIMLRREGWPVNRKLIERLYREEGLTLKRKKPKRRRSAVRRERSTPAASVNERWAMDFVHDTLSNSRTVRVLTVLDVYSRECVALEAGVGFRGEDVGPGAECGSRGTREPAEDDLGGQRDGVHFESTRSLGVLEPGQARLQPAGKADRQPVHRGVQR